jgi:hypothetical protein
MRALVRSRAARIVCVRANLFGAAAATRGFCLPSKLHLNLLSHGMISLYLRTAYTRNAE